LGCDEKLNVLDTGTGRRGRGRTGMESKNRRVTDVSLVVRDTLGRKKAVCRIQKKEDKKYE